MRFERSVRAGFSLSCGNTEGRYAIDRKAGRRALVGLDDAGYTGLYTALRHPDLCTRLGLLSPSWEPGYREQNTALIKAPSEPGDRSLNGK